MGFWVRVTWKDPKQGQEWELQRGVSKYGFQIKKCRRDQRDVEVF